MATISTITAKPGAALRLGYAGENLARRVVFPIEGWRELYGEGVVTLIALRNGDADPYVVPIEVEDGAVIWKLRRVDMAVPGPGECELQYTVGDVVVKDEKWITQVYESMSEPGDEPEEPDPTYLEQVIKAGADAKASAMSADASAKKAENAAGMVSGATKMAQEQAQKAFVSATEAEKAKIAVENLTVDAESLPTDAPATVTKTLENGIVNLLFGLPAGPRGVQGATISSIDRTDGDGSPGTTDTYTITLTDGSTTTFQVYNGKDGEGAGDMTAAVYDPQKKSQDIFKYVDDAIGNIDVDVTADEVTFSDGETFQQKYDSGELTGPDGVGIQSIVQTTTSAEDGGENVVTITLTNGATATFKVKNGGKGGKGDPGSPATINGVNALTIQTDEYIEATQSGSVLTLGLKSAPSSSEGIKVTLTTSGWTDNGDGRYRQTANVAGVTTDASQIIVVDVYVDGTDLDADATVQGAWGPDDGSGPGSQNIVQGNGALTFYCTTPPTVNIPVSVGVH